LAARSRLISGSSLTGTGSDPPALRHCSTAERKSRPESESQVPIVPAFHSVNEVKKPVGKQVHHNNSNCAAGRDVPTWERQIGTGGYRLCDDCQRETNAGR